MYLKKYDSECNFFPGDSFSQWENNFSHWPLLWSCVHELYQRTGASSRVVDIKHDLKNITSFCQRWPHTHTHTRTQHVFQKKKLFLKFFWLFFWNFLIFFLKISKNHIFRHFEMPVRRWRRSETTAWLQHAHARARARAAEGIRKNIVLNKEPLFKKQKMNVLLFRLGTQVYMSLHVFLHF